MRKHMLLRNPNYTVSLWLPVQSTPAGELFHFVFVPLLPIRWVHGSRSSVAGLRSQVLCFQMCVYVWEVCTCVYERVHACTNTCMAFPLMRAFLRYGLTMQNRLAWTHDPSASASQVLGLQVCITTAGSWVFFLQCLSLNSGPTPWATPPTLLCDGFFFFFFKEI
jgi:hypothetical protein